MEISTASASTAARLRNERCRMTKMLALLRQVKVAFPFAGHALLAVSEASGCAAERAFGGVLVLAGVLCT